MQLRPPRAQRSESGPHSSIDHSLSDTGLASSSLEWDWYGGYKGSVGDFGYDDIPASIAPPPVNTTPSNSDCSMPVLASSERSR